MTTQANTEMETVREQANGELRELVSGGADVDALTDIQVMDVFVRGKFMHAIASANSAAYRRTEDYKHVKKSLREGNSVKLKEVAIQESHEGRNSDLARALGWEKGVGNVKTLFGRWMELSDEGVELAREKIRTALECSGMPRTEVIQSRVRYHQENPEALTE